MIINVVEPSEEPPGLLEDSGRSTTNSAPGFTSKVERQPHHHFTRGLKATLHQYRFALKPVEYLHLLLRGLSGVYASSLKPQNALQPAISLKEGAKEMLRSSSL